MKQLDEVKEAVDNTEGGDLLREKFKVFSGFLFLSSEKKERRKRLIPHDNFV